VSGTQRSAAYFLGTVFPNGLSTNQITQVPLQDLTVSTVRTGAVLLSGASVTQTTNYLVINKGTPSATAVLMIAASVPPFLMEYTVKDGGYNCATNNITLTPPSGLIDGKASFVMKINGMAVTYHFDGTNYWITHIALPALGQLPGSTSYSNDAAAAASGVAIGDEYLNGSLVMMRRS
jgi:hypothetical protein